MDPSIEHRDLRPPPQPGPPGGLLVAILIHVLVIAAVVWGIQWTPDASRDSAPETRETALAPPEQTLPARPAVVPGVSAPPVAPGIPSPPAQSSQSASPARQATPALAPTHAVCPVRPLLAAAGARDGQLVPPANVSGGLDKDIDALLVAGKEAAAAGRVRDAEVAFLTSCRVADARKGAGSIESANARYQLARHYVEFANTAATLPAAQRGEMLAKARVFYEESLQRYRAAWGDSHEKTRFAAEGLQAAQLALRQMASPDSRSPALATAGMGAGPATAPAAQERQSAAQPPGPTAPVREVESNTKARDVVANSSAQRARAKPSFDCRKARSYAERTICSDAQLSQLDYDLSRLHARARQGAADPAAFRRQNDAEWRRRERTCRDRNCLLRWYATRRQQLTQFLPAAGRNTAR